MLSDQSLHVHVLLGIRESTGLFSSTEACIYIHSISYHTGHCISVSVLSG